MISKISVENGLDKVHTTNPAANLEKKQNLGFKGGGAWALCLQGIQECEKNPMINVAVIDMLSAILPRTIVESLTNWFAGFEAFRRESSGLVVNCLIPSFIAYTFATMLNPLIMPKGTNMASGWADSSLIKKLTESYKNSKSDDKAKDTLKEILGGIEGYNGKNKVLYSKDLSKKDLEAYTEKLKNLTDKDISRKELHKEIKKLAKEISEKTHVFENITTGNGEVNASTITTLLEDSVKFLKEYTKRADKNIDITEFAKKSNKLVKSKSVLGLMVILPLAASMQYINRKITEKLSGVKGAPIYDDYGKNKIQDEKAKEGLLKQKFISISSMIGVSLLSMMKIPSWNMFEFKGIFPTMDQARVISTTTFASRMAAADDRNELAEATVRDIATFSSLYFLGDYASKAAATIIQNKTGVELLNETKQLKGDENIFKRIWHWVKNVHVKSSEEVFSKTAEELKKKRLTPTEKEKVLIEKELKRAVNLRSACQLTNLGVSLLLLGLIIPIFTRKNTKRKHAEAIKLAQMSSSSGGTNTDERTSASTPLNLEYSSLTTGFRSDRRQK